MNKPSIIKGGFFADERGIIKFANDFKLQNIKRFYTITHNDCVAVRAWQGHQIEQKYFFVVQGMFKVAFVKIDNWETPSSELKAEQFLLSEKNPEVLYIPEGYANGFKAVEENSTLIVFSNLELEDSLNDNYRYDKQLWFNWD